ncbi:MAG: hypothetical protein H0U85_04995 [Gemmatimonadales bacterium]|nr:hypothetical protein [Gemmatimonadales bacterium]
MTPQVLSLSLIAIVLVALHPSPALAQNRRAASIASATAAAPRSISRDATVLAWPDSSGRMAKLRSGTNGWTCLPSQRKTKYISNNAMCLDANFLELVTAMVAQRPPVLKGVGYAYMLTNDTWESNTDPAGVAPTSDNQWHHAGSHVMVVYPDRSALAGLPTEPGTSGPYVMWASTPYAHVMWPVK